MQKKKKKQKKGPSSSFEIDNNKYKVGCIYTIKAFRKKCTLYNY